MNNYELELQRSMSNEQRMAFQSEVNSRRKDGTVGVLLAVFLGGLGAHHFYLNKNGLGVLYVLFCWTFIPAIIALIEAFLMPGRVEHWNNDLATQTATRIRLLYSQSSSNIAFPGTVYCSKCGTQMSAGSRFCPSCGVAAAASAT